MASEREYKFSLIDDRFPDAEEVRAALSQKGFEVQALGTRSQRDRYVDTPDGALRAQSWALRTRDTEGERLATLKAAGEVSEGLHQREELEEPMTGEAWPDPIRERLDSLEIDPSTLRPTVLVENQRTRYFVSRAGTELAEISFDEVEATRPEGETRVQFSELEIEAREGSEDDLRTIADALDRLLPLTPNSINKLERADTLLSLAESMSDD